MRAKRRGRRAKGAQRRDGDGGEAEGAGAGEPGAAPGQRDLRKASAYLAQSELDRPFKR